MNKKNGNFKNYFFPSPFSRTSRRVYPQEKTTESKKNEIPLHLIQNSINSINILNEKLNNQNLKEKLDIEKDRIKKI